MLEGQGKNDDLMNTAFAVTTGLYFHYLRILQRRYTPGFTIGQEKSPGTQQVDLPLVRCGIRIGPHPSASESVLFGHQ